MGSVRECWTHSSSSNRQSGCATASQRCLTPWSPTSFTPTIKDFSWEVPLLSTEPSSLKTDWVNSHRFKLQGGAEYTVIWNSPSICERSYFITEKSEEYYYSWPHPSFSNGHPGRLRAWQSSSAPSWPKSFTDRSSSDSEQCSDIKASIKWWQHSPVSSQSKKLK